ncbi:hypothetical protein [Haloferax sulfurifontis]|uniref:Ig-like domain-containing protein n=1 Tax=Haloferax sulfurifontis ATCC BAA-897 TaxID=662480 RepID=M0IU04_9EURY|nr:hypothetical protein [Haloferax sulfurifontis]ELZ99303.1 hypothetical protein C441_00225 [Haloferax sulfurifontis ATCC BAA-897]
MKRRALLSTVAGSALGLAGGCLSDTDAPTDTPTNPQTTTAATDGPAESDTPGPGSESGAGLSVVNEDDEPHALSVRVTDGDETRVDSSLDVGAGPGYGRNVANDLVDAGRYRVVAELDTGATLDYEWTVTNETRRLELVVTSDAGLEPRQRVTPALDDADLPYSVPGSTDIFSPPTAGIRNRSDADARLTVAIEHGGTRFFEHAFDAATDREISTPALVKSHGTYEVFVEADDGRTATHEWHIPEKWAWPTLAVLVADDGSLRVGSGWPEMASVRVTNEDETERDLTLTLVRPDDADAGGDDAGGAGTDSGGTVVSETAQTVPPGESTVAVDIPIGDEYELTVETAAGSETVDYPACYCWSTTAEVTVGGNSAGGSNGGDDGPSVESFQYVCE